MASTLMMGTTAEMLREVTEEARVLMARKPVTVSLVVADKDAHAAADAEKIRLIARAALNNAARTTERGRITLILGTDGPFLKLTVTDTGAGTTSRESLSASRNDCARVCGKKREPNLSLIRKLVKTLYGTIAVSRRSGSGSIVEIWLPATERKPRRTVPFALPSDVCNF